MIKSELIERLSAQNPHLYRRDAAAIVDAILDTITAGLARGDRVELRGFGMFTVKKRLRAVLRGGQPTGCGGGRSAGARACCAATGAMVEQQAKLSPSGCEARRKGDAGTRPKLRRYRK